MRRHLAWLLVLSSLLVEARARACRPGPCQPIHVTDAAQVPANLPGLVFSFMGDISRAKPTLRRGKSVLRSELLLRDAAQGMLHHLALVRPREPFQVGARYELEVANGDCERKVVSYEVVEPLPLPTDLGRLTSGTATRGTLHVASGASCSTHIDAAQLPLALEPSEATRAWLPFLDMQTIVDGSPWEARKSAIAPATVGASWEGRGVDRLFVRCDGGEHAERGLPPGTHVVKMVATLPGSSVRLESSELTVSLGCEPPAEPSKAAEVPAVKAAPATPASQGEPGGGCQAVGRPGALPWSGAVLLALTAVLTRRRRRAHRA